MRFGFTLLVLGSLGFTSLAGRAHAQRCDLPQVLLSVDKSSSMLGELPSGGTKWDAARMAIGELTSAYAESIAFGLQVFPYPDRCEPGAVTMDFGTHTPEAIMAGLGEPPPSGGNWTPMAQTLDAARDHYASRLAVGGNHLILITDGWQWCDPYEATTRFTPVAAVTALRDAGVTVHVVGFGAGVDSLTLNRAAVAAGTALPGCDASLSEPSAMNHCYVQANDLIELRAALDSIARDITDEMCDGLDNDCDGTVDEGFDVDVDGYTTCGSDPSMPGVDPDPTLVDCDDMSDVVYPGAPEVCDGVDNDCDGTTDPGCACVDGDAQPCGTDVGACMAGTQSCEGGTWGACAGGVMPAAAETCDMTDEDCDGEVDEGADASCAEGEACTADGCIPLTPPDPPAATPTPDRPAEVDVVQDTGCACRAGAPTGSSPFGLLAGLGLLGLAVIRRR
ncbi:MAG: VWA domain-containing protein [Sandaracinaceae bacterium]|nr:VWA domain-containing protein [Sandaracinaceae bacterium]